jgi:WD40 repeat protein
VRVDQHVPSKPVRELGVFALLPAIISAASAGAAPLATAELGFVRGPTIFLASSGGEYQRIVLRGTAVTPYSEPSWSKWGRLAVRIGNNSSPGDGSSDVAFVQPGSAPVLVPRVGVKFEGDPAWSADGDHLVHIGFINRWGGTVCLSHLGAGRCKWVSTDTSAENLDAEPASSPNGRAIAFVRAENVVASSAAADNPPFRLFLASPAGLARRQLTQTLAHNPSWSPDSKRIVFDNGGDIIVVKPNGSGFRHLTTTRAVETDPAWSPNGRQIAFVRTGSIWVMDANGKHMRLLVRNASQPAWKPR